MKINDAGLVVEGRTEALAVSVALLDLDASVNRGRLRQDHEYPFTSLGQMFEPPLPLEKHSKAKVLGRRLLEVFTDEDSTEHTLRDVDNVEHAVRALSLAVMPTVLLSRGSRLGIKRYLREKRMEPIFDHLRNTTPE